MSNQNDLKGIHRAFTTHYKGLSNKLMNNVFISLPGLPTPDLPQPCKTEFIALWDTGATMSSISNKVIQECKLKPFTIAEVSGINNIDTTEVYRVNIYLPNKVVIWNIPVTHGKALGKDFDILIGMDVISKGDFAISNLNGITAFTFRYPSIETIDFVHKIPITNPNKPGRNSLCPCGSGKKYKKCCGK